MPSIRPATPSTPARLDGDLDPRRFAYLTPDPAGHVSSLGRVVEYARTLAARAADWEELIRFDPVRRWRHRLELNPAELPAPYQAWLLSWLPGQGTGAHDHGRASAVFVVLRGRLEETAVSPLHRRARQQSVGAGQLRYWAPRHVRELTNREPAAAVSLHVYRLDDGGAVDAGPGVAGLGGVTGPNGDMSASW